MDANNVNYSPNGRYGLDHSTPQTTHQANLESWKEKFRTQTKSGSKLLDYLRRSECGVWRCEQDERDKKRWWLNITLPGNVAEMFDIHLELQLVYVEYTTVEPRLLEIIQKRISDRPRLDQGIFIIASFDENINRLLRRRRGEYAGISLPLDELTTTDVDIRNRMSSVLTRVDHFDITAPINNPGGFFGRTTEIRQLNSSIERGQSVGVFGLRKTGKTSLLNYVLKKRREAGRPVVYLDISRIATGDAFRLELLLETWKCATGINQGGGKIPTLSTLNKNGELKVDLGLLKTFWVRDMTTLSEFVGSRIEVYIDEIDQIEPDRSYLGEISEDMRVAFTQLRGLIQNPDPDSGLVLVCAGVDPAIFEKPLLSNKSDNLLYKLVVLHFLSPLNREEMAEMVRDLGRRMGIRVRDARVLDFLFSEYGGHALLTRKACSLAARSRDINDVPWHMELSSVEEVANVRSDGSPFLQAAEILEAFGVWFPNEAELLRHLWSSDPEERDLGMQIYNENPEMLIHAAPYGILEQDGVRPRIGAVERAVKNGK